MQRILYRIMDWGLGHATRNLPLLKRLAAAGHAVTVATSGRSLKLLQNELGDQVAYSCFPEHLPTRWGRDYHWLFLLPKVPFMLPAAIASVQREQQRIQRLLAGGAFDLVIADNCYGSYANDLPCYFISHHLKVHWFIPNRLLHKLNEWLVARWVNRFSRILVPDYEEHGLSGSLSREFTFIDRAKVAYIGILSDLVPDSREKDIDCFICLSGSEPQRTSFERLVMDQAATLEGRIVIALGKTEKDQRPRCAGPNITVYNFCSAALRNELFNRARTVVARFGYSTVMDLVELQISSALLVPTPNHTEQEYLSRYHRQLNYYFSIPQKALNLALDIRRARQHRCRFPFLVNPTRSSVDKFMTVLGLEGAW